MFRGRVFNDRRAFTGARQDLISRICFGFRQCLRELDDAVCTGVELGHERISPHPPVRPVRQLPVITAGKLDAANAGAGKYNKRRSQRDRDNIHSPAIEIRQEADVPLLLQLFELGFKEAPLDQVLSRQCGRCSRQCCCRSCAEWLRCLQFRCFSSAKTGPCGW